MNPETTLQRKFAENPAYREFESLLHQLHRLVADDKGDTAESDTLRDRMELPEQKLSAEELERLNGLSADLYMLQDRETLVEVPPADWPSRRLADEILRAWKEERWEELLGLLRIRGRPYAPPQVAYLRAVAYDKLGHPESALLFSHYAFRLKPDATGYQSLILQLLLRLKRPDQAAGISQELARQKHRLPRRHGRSDSSPPEAPQSAAH